VCMSSSLGHFFSFSMGLCIHPSLPQSFLDILCLSLSPFRQLLLSLILCHGSLPFCIGPQGSLLLGSVSATTPPTSTFFLSHRYYLTASWSQDMVLGKSVARGK
jgi:hypothetical protein